MSEIAAALAIPVPFEFEGVQYRIAGQDFEIEALFELWLQDNDIRSIRQRARTLLDAEYAAMMNGHRRDVAAKQFAYGGTIFWEAMMSLPGRKKMAQLQLSKGSGFTVEMDVVEKIFDSPKDLEIFLIAKQEADSDPNLPRPWTARMG